MKRSFTVASLLFASIASAQIMRSENSSHSGTPTRGSNYNDRTSVGRVPPTNTNRASNPPAQTRGSNYNDRTTVGQTQSSPRPASHNQRPQLPAQGRGCNFSCKQMEGFIAPSFTSDKTPTGILLDTAWKKKLNNFALKNVVHPAWGYTHSERDYHNTIKIAEAEGVLVDEDVIFAVAFLHDLGGLEKFEIAGVDHGVRSAELAEQLLKSFGFPEEKISTVKEVIIGHVYSQPKPKSELALAFRDADIIDFLGPLGIARLLAASSELGSTPKGNILQSLEVAKKLRDQLPKQLTFEVSKNIAQKRIKEGDQLLKQLERDSVGGLAL